MNASHMTQESKQSMYLKKDDNYIRGELKSKRGSFDDQHKRQICAFRAAGFSQIDFLSKRAGYDGEERAHGGLELCDQERQKDLQGQRAAGRRRQGLVLGNLELQGAVAWTLQKHDELQRINKKQAGLLVVVDTSVMEYM